MRFRTINHNLINSAIDNDWYAQEEIKRRNMEERKRLLQQQREEQKQAKLWAKPKDLLRNMSRKQQKLYKTFQREELYINKQNDLLNKQWNNELAKRTRVLKDENWAHKTMFDNDYAAKWNQKSQKLFRRMKKNYGRLHRLI
jgi:hypothetical protein